jgi:hypothetical protein
VCLKERIFKYSHVNIARRAATTTTAAHLYSQEEIFFKTML